MGDSNGGDGVVAVVEAGWTVADAAVWGGVVVEAKGEDEVVAVAVGRAEVSEEAVEWKWRYGRGPR